MPTDYVITRIFVTDLFVMPSFDCIFKNFLIRDSIQEYKKKSTKIDDLGFFLPQELSVKIFKFFNLFTHDCKKVVELFIMKYSIPLNVQDERCDRSAYIHRSLTVIFMNVKFILFI